LLKKGIVRAFLEWHAPLLQEKRALPFGLSIIVRFSRCGRRPPFRDSKSYIIISLFLCQPVFLQNFKFFTNVNSQSKCSSGGGCGVYSGKRKVVALSLGNFL